MGINVKKVGIRTCAASECLFGAQDLQSYAYRSGYPELIKVAITLLNKISSELACASNEEMAYVEQIQQLASTGRLLRPARNFAMKHIKTYAKVLRNAAASPMDIKRIMGFAMDAVNARFSTDGSRTR